MKILVKAGRIIDPANNIDEVLDILIDGDKISKVAKNINPSASSLDFARDDPERAKRAKRVEGPLRIDAKEKIVIPGLVDMHVHLRQPGREDKETVASGTLAALKGGVTSVLAMPNTTPAIDCAESVELLKKITRQDSRVNVFICAAITEGRLGLKLTDIARLKGTGAIAISDDGASVDSEELFSEALRQAKANRVLVITHCEDNSISAKGMVNFGLTSTRLGLRGIPNESEYKRVERDINLAERIGSPIHIAHVSCKESVEIIDRAKKKGLKVTCETAPHYFALSEEAVLGYDTNAKMNPPLRAKEDVIAVKEGLKSGVIDAIASDHAPHTQNEKEIEFESAEFGVIGLETELAVAITELVKTGILDWPGLVQKMSLNPAKILGINKGTLSVGRDADIIVISPDKEWQVRKEDFISKSKNSCFIARELSGIVEYTILGGKIAYKR